MTGRASSAGITGRASRAGMTGRRLLAVSHTGLFSGAERVLLHYATAAREAGWSVSVATPAGTMDETMRAAGFVTSALADLKLGDGPRPVAAARLAARWVPAARQLRRIGGDADVVLVNGLLALPAARLARLRAPLCWLVHDVVVRNDLEMIVRGSAGAVDLAIAVSDAAGALARRLGIPTVVARNGARWPVDAAPDTAPPDEDGRPIVGINAMLTPWKGHLVLLDAMARVPTATVELMGGSFPKDGDHVEVLRRRASQPDLAGRVRFLGQRSDPLDVMRRWTVAVNASVDPEAAPLSVLEAMSIGLPVVATDHGGSSEVLGEAGVLVPPRDAGALAGAVSALLADPVRRARCRDAGRHAVAERYNLDQTTDRFLDLLAAATTR